MAEVVKPKGIAHNNLYIIINQSNWTWNVPRFTEIDVSSFFLYPPHLSVRMKK
eukprot:SAG22_NODE_104_length_20159_cov_5.877517_6_plen_53_part_00